MSAHGKRPICQDTGIVLVFVKVDGCYWDKTDLTVQQMVDEGTPCVFESRQQRYVHLLLQTLLVLVKTQKIIPFGCSY